MSRCYHAKKHDVDVEVKVIVKVKKTEKKHHKKHHRQHHDCREFFVCIPVRKHHKKHHCECHHEDRHFPKGHEDHEPKREYPLKDEGRRPGLPVPEVKEHREDCECDEFGFVRPEKRYQAW